MWYFYKYRANPALKPKNFEIVLFQDELYCAVHYDHEDFTIGVCKDDYSKGIINTCIYLVIPSTEKGPGRYIYGCAPLSTLPSKCAKEEHSNKPQPYYFPYATITYNGSKISGALFCCGDHYCNESEEPPISAVRLKTEGEWTEAAMDSFPIVFCIVVLIVCLTPQFAEFVDKIFVDGRQRAETAPILPKQSKEPVVLKQRNKKSVVKAKFSTIKQLNEALRALRHPENHVLDFSDDEKEVKIHDTVYNYRCQEHKVTMVQRAQLTNKSRLAERMIEHGPYEFNFDLIELAEMFDTVSRVFAKEPTILDLSADIFIIGNLEGSYADLFRWLNLFGWPPKRKILFLGGLSSDKVFHSLETISLIFALKLQCPDHVFVLRGASECTEIDLKHRFPRRIANALSDVILRTCYQLPLAATIASKIFCSHGGVPITLRSLGEIRRIRRPIHDIRKSTIEADLIFSVVSNQNALVAGSRAHMFDPCSHEIIHLLQSLQMSIFIRSRNPVKDGHQFLGGNHYLSIWSAPGHEDTTSGTVISITPDKTITLLRLSADESAQPGAATCPSEPSVRPPAYAKARPAKEPKQIDNAIFMRVYKQISAEISSFRNDSPQASSLESSDDRENSSEGNEDDDVDIENMEFTHSQNSENDSYVPQYLNMGQSLIQSSSSTPTITVPAQQEDRQMVTNGVVSVSQLLRFLRDASGYINPSAETRKYLKSVISPGSTLDATYCNISTVRVKRKYPEMDDLVYEVLAKAFLLGFGYPSNHASLVVFTSMMKYAMSKVREDRRALAERELCSSKKVKGVGEAETGLPEKK